MLVIGTEKSLKCLLPEKKKFKIAELEHWVKKKKKMSHAAIKEDREFSGNVRKKPTSHPAGLGEDSNCGSSSEGNNN